MRQSGEKWMKEQHRSKGQIYPDDRGTDQNQRPRCCPALTKFDIVVRSLQRKD